MESLFMLGQVMFTPGAIEMIGASPHLTGDFLRRHAEGDWSEMEPEDQETNREAILKGSRIFSSFKLSETQKIWVITDAANDDGIRHHTTILLPEEY
jgi:hypothetical protein